MHAVCVCVRVFRVGGGGVTRGSAWTVPVESVTPWLVDKPAHHQETAGREVGQVVVWCQTHGMRLASGRLFLALLVSPFQSPFLQTCSRTFEPPLLQSSSLDIDQGQLPRTTGADVHRDPMQQPPSPPLPPAISPSSQPARQHKHEHEHEHEHGHVARQDRTRKMWQIVARPKWPAAGDGVRCCVFFFFFFWEAL